MAFRITKAIAADVREGPLQAAKQNIERWKAENGVSTRLSDGLKSILPQEAEDIVIAGMGGELIARIIQEASWLKQGEKRLILQPMTCQTQLRKFLAEEGFAILKEKAVQEPPRVYTVILAAYDPQNVLQFPGWEEIGGLTGETPAERCYLLKRAASLRKQANGLRLAGKEQEAKDLEETIQILCAKAENSGKDEDR